MDNENIYKYVYIIVYMDNKKVDALVSELKKIHSILAELGVAEGVIEKKVKTFGNGGHVVLPKQHLNKRVRVIVG